MVQGISLALKKRADAHSAAPAAAVGRANEQTEVPQLANSLMSDPDLSSVIGRDIAQLDKQLKCVDA
jgi:hypothetical protein